MAYTFNENIVSDLHKDAYGFRPGERFWMDWETYTDAEKQECWDHLISELDQAIDRQRKAEAAALAQFEDLIQQMKDLGAETTRQAIKWVFHGEQLNRYDLQYGADYVAYHFGMAYNNPYKAVIQECCDQALKVIEEEAA